VASAKLGLVGQYGTGLGGPIRSWAWWSGKAGLGPNKTGLNGPVRNWAWGPVQNWTWRTYRSFV